MSLLIPPNLKYLTPEKAALKPIEVLDATSGLEKSDEAETVRFTVVLA